MSDKVSFASLDLGSAQPTYRSMDKIEVELSSENLLGDYARGFVREAFRVNPLRAEQVDLKAEELEQYAHFLLYQRVLCVNGNCKDFRRLKTLYIPAYLQYALSMIGEYIDRDKGYWFVPTCVEPSINLQEALEISNKIGAFENDLQVLQDAMPRDPKGDRNVMTTAVIANYVMAKDKVQHVSATYLAAFLGFKVKEDIAMKAIYEIRYDDVAFIASALTRLRGLY